MSRISVALASLSFLVLAQSPLRATDETSKSEPIPTVVFGFDLIDTSLEGEMKGVNKDETKRIEELTKQLPELIEKSGSYKLIGEPADIAAFQKDHNLQGCNGCAGDFAKKAGAKLAIWGTVQKVSNLILNVNLYELDADTGRQESMSTDIRGNTDDSWRHGLEWLVKNRLLKLARP